MLIHILDHHDYLLRAVKHPATKRVLTHSGVGGFSLDFFNALFGRHLHVFEHFYLIIREPIVSYSALALGLVIYCDWHPAHRRKPSLA